MDLRGRVAIRQLVLNVDISPNSLSSLALDSGQE